MTVDIKFEFGDIVYIKTDIEQLPRQMIQVSIMKNNIQYQVSQGDHYTWVQEFELSRERDNVLSLLN